MGETTPTLAQEIGQAALAFQKECSGITPGAVTVLVGGETLVVTLQGALSAGEREMARTPEGAARVRELHRELFADSAEPLHVQFQKILGVGVRESAVETGPTKPRFVEVFPSGALVQVFLLSAPVAPQAWSSMAVKLPEMGE